MKRELALREELIWVCRRLEDRGYIAATDGNVSIRVEDDLMLITPSGKAKGDLLPIDLLLVTMEGEVLCGRGNPSSEIRMHQLVYRRRDDVHAVVHAHPPMLTALTLAGVPFLAEALPEVWLTIGPVPTVPYATPGTEELPLSLSAYIEKHMAILMERHGSLTVGKTAREAYLRLEKLEHGAHILFFAQLLKSSPPSPLPREALGKLEQLFHT